MDHLCTAYFFIAVTAFVIFSEETDAQQTNEDFKYRLKESIKNSGLNSGPKLQYQNPQQSQNQNSGVLKVSPTTKLPTRYDNVISNWPVTPEEIAKTEKEIAEKARIPGSSQPDRAAINYSDGKIHPVPDARSISQFTQHTRDDYDLGLYADDDSPEWMRSLRNYITPRYRNIDLDPVRNIQRYKAKKHKEQVDKIKQAYEDVNN
jgi:hypothetical protein